MVRLRSRHRISTRKGVFGFVVAALLTWQAAFVYVRATAPDQAPPGPALAPQASPVPGPAAAPTATSPPRALITRYCTGCQCTTRHEVKDTTYQGGPDFNNGQLQIINGCVSPAKTSTMINGIRSKVTEFTVTKIGTNIFQQENF